MAAQSSQTSSMPQPPKLSAALDSLCNPFSLFSNTKLPNNNKKKLNFILQSKGYSYLYSAASSLWTEQKEKKMITKQ
jgi:hypothetical protein